MPDERYLWLTVGPGGPHTGMGAAGVVERLAKRIQR